MYCAFIIIIIGRGFKRDLFTVKEIRVTLMVCYEAMLYNLSY
jgi:hypothetical protein